MALIESILGSLTAAAITKVVKEISEQLADFKSRAQEIKDDELREELEKQIEEAERQLRATEEEVIKQTVAKISGPAERMFDLYKIMPAFERAGILCKPNMTVQQGQKIGVELGQYYIRDIIEKLSVPLEIIGEEAEAQVTRVNNLTNDLTQVYRMYSKGWDSSGITRFLTCWHELLMELEKLLKERVKYA